MNAGMYHPDRRPVGLFVQDGVELARIVTSAGPGNFGMLPNGVFCAGADFAVIESRDFAARQPTCALATQSGPMLVIDGTLHPTFLADSTSRYLRNGVGGFDRRQDRVVRDLEPSRDVSRICPSVSGRAGDTRCAVS